MMMVNMCVSVSEIGKVFAEGYWVKVKSAIHIVLSTYRRIGKCSSQATLGCIQPPFRFFDEISLSVKKTALAQQLPACRLFPAKSAVFFARAEEKKVKASFFPSEDSMFFPNSNEFQCVVGEVQTLLKANPNFWQILGKS